MTTTNNSFAETTIVAFHIGRGGRFHNPGHLSFLGEHKISKYAADLFLHFENERECMKAAKERIGEYLWENAIVDGYNGLEDYYYDLCNDNNFGKLEEVFGITADDLGEEVYVDQNGNQVGLTEAEAKKGVGRIVEDGEYDTTYAKYLSDCSEEELRLIVDNEMRTTSDIVEYAKEQLGIVDEEETEDEE